MNTRLLIIVGLRALLVTDTEVHAGDMDTGKVKTSKHAGCHGADGMEKAPNPTNIDRPEFCDVSN